MKGGSASFLLQIEARGQWIERKATGENCVVLAALSDENGICCAGEVGG